MRAVSGFENVLVEDSLFQSELQQNYHKIVLWIRCGLGPTSKARVNMSAPMFPLKPRFLAVGLAVGACAFVTVWYYVHFQRRRASRPTGKKKNKSAPLQPDSQCSPVEVDAKSNGRTTILSDANRRRSASSPPDFGFYQPLRFSRESDSARSTIKTNPWASSDELQQLLYTKADSTAQVRPQGEAESPEATLQGQMIENNPADLAKHESTLPTVSYPAPAFSFTQFQAENVLPLTLTTLDVSLSHPRSTPGSLISEETSACNTAHTSGGDQELKLCASSILTLVKDSPIQNDEHPETLDVPLHYPRSTPDSLISEETSSCNAALTSGGDQELKLCVSSILALVKDGPIHNEERSGDDLGSLAHLPQTGTVMADTGPERPGAPQHEKSWGQTQLARLRILRQWIREAKEYLISSH
nr:PREDICTED: uncharacterized protein LOC107077201 [Lepisosteus oculatus]